MKELPFYGKLDYFRFEQIGNNSYNVTKRNFPFGFEHVATITVNPGISYELTAIKKISPRDVEYLRTEARKLAGIESGKIQTTVISC